MNQNLEISCHEIFNLSQAMYNYDKTLQVYFSTKKIKKARKKTKLYKTVRNLLLCFNHSSTRKNCLRLNL